MLTQKDFIDHLAQTYKDALSIVEKKNNDYASATDPYKNFRFASLLGIGVDEAILVRISDKLARIANLLHKEAEVKDEAIEDTLLDAINYLAILKAHRDHKKAGLTE